MEHHQLTLDLTLCEICDAYALAERRLSWVDAAGCEHSCELCARCADQAATEIRSELLRYRPHCRHWYYDDDHDGWRGSHTYRPDAMPTDDAVFVEMVRRAGRPWRSLYLSHIAGQSTAPGARR